MAWHWRRLALAALAAAAVGLTCAVDVEAQAPAKTAKKAKAQKPAESEEPADGDEAPAAKPAKKVKQDPAQAQKTIEAAAKLLETGKADQATQSLSTVLSGGNLPPAIMAKALLYRGMAYRQQKMPAQAIADLTNALWLKGGLGESDRADALRQRTAAYQEAGLSQGGDAVAALPSSSRGTTRSASAGDNWAATASPPTSGAQEPPAAPKQSSGGWSLSNPFSALFGGNSSPAPQSAPPQAAPPPPPATTSSIDTPPPTTAAPAPRPQTSAWSRNTEVHGSTSPTPVAATTTVTAPPKPDGRFRIQVGMVRTEDEAQALVAKIKREHATVAAREPEVDEAVVGNMGSFYRVRLGPFATAQEGQAACAKLKGSGIDCLVVTQ